MLLFWGASPLCASRLIYTILNCQNNPLLSSLIIQKTHIQRGCTIRQKCWTQDWSAVLSNSRSLTLSTLPLCLCWNAVSFTTISSQLLEEMARPGQTYKEKDLYLAKQMVNFAGSPWEEGPICPSGSEAFRGPTLHRTLQ